MLVSRKTRVGSASVQKVLAAQKGKPRSVLEGLLARFEDGHEELDSAELLLRRPPFDRLGRPWSWCARSGDGAKLEAAVLALEEALYER